MVVTKTLGTKERHNVLKPKFLRNLELPNGFGFGRNAQKLDGRSPNPNMTYHFTVGYN
jgi:hypothetical protein